MGSKSVYFEKQKFDQTWIKLIIYSVFILGAILSFVIFFTTARNVTALIPLIAGVSIFLLFQNISLKVTIDDKGISYLFSPFQFEKRTIKKEDINQISIRTYDPVSEYGGWGIRFGKAGKAFTVSGIYGINIVFREKRKLMIGTSRPKDVYNYLVDHQYNPVGGEP